MEQHEQKIQDYCTVRTGVQAFKAVLLYNLHETVNGSGVDACVTWLIHEACSDLKGEEKQEREYKRE